MIDQDSFAKRFGLAIITAIACAYAAAGAGVSDAQSVGAICGAAGYSVVSARYGAQSFTDDLTRDDLRAAGLMAAVGFLFRTDGLDLPPATKSAVVAAMVVAGATEIVKGSGITAGFNALMATMIVALLCAVLAIGVHAAGGADLLIGAVTGFVVVIIGMSPMSALVGVALGASLRIGADAGFSTITGYFR